MECRTILEKQVSLLIMSLFAEPMFNFLKSRELIGNLFKSTLLYKRTLESFSAKNHSLLVISEQG